MNNKKYKILLIDDDKFLLAYEQKYKEAGCEVVRFSDAEGDIVQRVLEVKPDVIVLDIIMPVRIGWDALSLLKKDARTKDIPVFMASNQGQKEDIEESLKLGATDHFVISHFIPSELIKLVLGYLSNPQSYKQVAWTPKNFVYSHAPTSTTSRFLGYSGKGRSWILIALGYLDVQLTSSPENLTPTYLIFLGVINVLIILYLFQNEILGMFNRIRKSGQGKNKSEIVPEGVANHYKRGVFVLVNISQSGNEQKIQFMYKSKGVQSLAPGYHLAIFNEIQFANWYLVNLVEELKRGVKSDLSANGQFLIKEILNQEEWDGVREATLADGMAKDAILNPCEGNETHRCPVMPVYFEQYTDFNKLKDMFLSRPNKHINLVQDGKRVSTHEIMVIHPDAKF